MFSAEEEGYRKPCYLQPKLTQPTFFSFTYDIISCYIYNVKKKPAVIKNK